MRWFPAIGARLAAVMVAIATFVPDGLADSADAQRAHQIVAKAAASLDAFRGDAAFPDVARALRSGTAVLVIPEFIRAGIGIGGEAGTGVLLKKNARNGKWGSPAFFDLQGASIGPQIGYQKAIVLLVIENDGTLEAILGGEITMGADAGYSAGTAHAQTVASKTGKQERGLQAFTRGEGAFAGATVKGMVVRPNSALNDAFYAAGSAPDKILTSAGLDKGRADGLRATLTKMAAAEAAARQ